VVLELLQEVKETIAAKAMKELSHKKLFWFDE
jgi:hypothetical protein